MRVECILINVANFRTGIPQTLQTGLHHVELPNHKSDEGSYEHRKRMMEVYHHPLCRRRE